MRRLFRDLGPRIVLASAAAAGLLVLAVGGAGAYAAGTADRPAGHSISAFERAQKEQDQTPDSMDLQAFGHTGLRAETTRLLGSDDDAIYYAAIDKVGYVCALVALKNSSLVTSACTTDAKLFDGGLGLVAYDAGARAEVAFFLLPDGAKADENDGLVGENILRVVPEQPSSILIGESRTKLPALPSPARVGD